MRLLQFCQVILTEKGLNGNELCAILDLPMPKFHQSEHQAAEHQDREPTKDELDAKHKVALEAKSIISWKSPDRIFVPRSKKYFTKIAFYALIAILAAIAFEEFVLVGVVLAMVFVAYVFATVEAETIEHRITNMGIVSGGKAFLWDELDSFWFDNKGDTRFLMVATNLRFPTRLIIILSSSVSDRTLLDLLEKHLHYHHAPVHTIMDKWANSLQKRINLD